MKTHWKKLTAMLIAAMLTFNMAGHAVVSFADDLVTNSPITDSAEGNDDPALDPDGNGQQTPADPNGNGQQTPTDPNANGQQTPADPNANGQQTPTDPNGNGQQTPTDPNGNSQQTPADNSVSQNSGANGTVDVPEYLVENAVCSLNGTEYSSWENAMKEINSLSNIDLRLMSNVIVSEQTDIPAGTTVVLDMQGHTITVTNSFSGRIFRNYGTLTIKGKGSVDVTNAGANGYGTVNNFGTLTVEGGTYTNQKDSDASNFYNRNGGKAYFYNPTIYGGGGCIATEINTTTEIHGGYYSDETYPAIENRGNMLITSGTFVNKSCSSCDKRWGYTVRSGESSDSAYLKIQDADVTGVQGGLAVIGGTADIYNGNYKTVACETHTNGSSAFYAGYFTGESYKTATNIYGGTFESCSKTAILVGNGNPAPDSGAGEESTVCIYDGTFIGGDTGKTAIQVNDEQYAIGAAKISGGNFSSDPTPYLAEGFEIKQNGDIYTVYDPTPVVPDPDPQPTPDPTPDTKPDTTPDTTPSRPSNNDRSDDDDTTTTVVTKPSTTTNQNKVEVVTKDDTTTATTKVPTKVQDETLTATVSESVLEEAVDKALETAEKKDTAPVVKINLGSSVDVSTMNVTLAIDSLETLAENEDAQLVLTSPVATVKFDAEALQAIADQANGEVTLKVVPVETNELTAEQRAVVGDNLVIELLLVSDGTYISDFEGGNATVTIPYELKDGETAEGLVVYFIDNDGKLYECETSYDAVNKCITFITPHFSKYVVGYESDKVMGGNVAGTVAGNTNSSSSDKYNPSTGSSNMVSVMALAATLSLGGLVAFGRKKR